MKININPVFITKIFYNPLYDNEVDAILENDKGKIISSAPLPTILNMIEIRKMSLINEKEVLDLIDIMYGIDYSYYGRTNARTI